MTEHENNPDTPQRHCLGPFPECIERLARIETKLETLIGNGQPGRIENLEKKVMRHDRWIWICTGGGAVIGYLLEKFLLKA